MNSLKIQYVSDIHLEMHDRRDTGTISPAPAGNEISTEVKNTASLNSAMFIKPGLAPYLVLCGDIGTSRRPALKTFLTWCSQNWLAVFYVPGNHEYYNTRTTDPKEWKTIPQINAELEAICAELPNVHFLQQRSMFLPEYNLRICGTTLWSAIDQEQDTQIIMYLSDVRLILHDEDKNFLPTLIRNLHVEQKDWLAGEIKEAETKGENVLVLTHHLPSYRLIDPKYEDNPLNSAFASHLDYMIRAPVRAWICGHSHSGQKLEINGVMCTLNPHGYPGEIVASRNAEATLEIPLSTAEDKDSCSNCT